MALDEAAVRHVALLSRLEIEDREVKRYARELSAVLAYAEQLQRLDLEGVPPLTEVHAEHPPRRPDRIGSSLPKAEILAAAPASDGTYFLVPPVVEYPE
jgi:aspartyl-tRNA(Asn)/glutamyl-tRNA(Gln) amidotransferase subunit C